MLGNINERSDGMVCLDLDAKVVWQTKNSPNLDKGGSVLTGDGLMYVMDGRTGELHIVEPSATGFKSLAKQGARGQRNLGTARASWRENWCSATKPRSSAWICRSAEKVKAPLLRVLVGCTWRGCISV
jgi:hypothetical protein